MPYGIHIATDLSSGSDHTANCVFYIGANGHVYVLDFYESPTEKSTMKLEDAIVLARWGTQRKNGVETRARVTLRNEALNVCKKRAEELMAAADKKAEAERVLIDVQVYGSDLTYGPNYRTVKRVFSDGTISKECRQVIAAQEILDAFNAGKKASLLERANAVNAAFNAPFGAKTPRYEDEV